VKPKILFWIDDGHIHFGISKFLYEKYPVEIFAVYDVNHITKNYYNNQKIVKFNKVWFWRDHLSSKPHKPDMNYLKNFEKKYGIHLWKIASMERRFLHYNESHKFTYKEILSIIEDTCKIFEKIIDEVKPDFLIIGVTDLLKNELFKQICEAKKVKILMLSQTRFLSRSIIDSDYDNLYDNNQPQITSSGFENTSQEEFLRKNNPRNGVDKKFINREEKLGIANLIKKNIKYLFKICNNDYRNFYENWGRTRIRYLLSKEFPLILLVKRSYRESYLNKIAKKQIDPSQPFVYFPLQHEPERTLLIDAPFYTNQIEIIKNIAKSLPIDFKLLVKEHFSMRTEAWRERRYYKNLQEIPNLELIHPSVDSYSLLKSCSLVATLTGTSALEAAFYQKPSIVFSDTSFSSLPFIARIRNVEELTDIIKSLLSKKFDYSLLNNYLKSVEDKSFDIDFMKLVYDVAIQIHGYHGAIREVDISPKQMESFLAEHKTFFEKLALEHIKKIKQYKKV